MNSIRIRSKYYQSLLETITKITYFRYIRYKRNKENKRIWNIMNLDFWVICKMSQSFKRKKPHYEIDYYAIWQYVWIRAINLCSYKMFLIPSLRISQDLPNLYVLFSLNQYLLRWILDFPMNLCYIFCKEFRSNELLIFWKGQSG